MVAQASHKPLEVRGGVRIDAVAQPAHHHPTKNHDSRKPRACLGKTAHLATTCARRKAGDIKIEGPFAPRNPPTFEIDSAWLATPPFCIGGVSLRTTLQDGSRPV